MSYEDPYPKAFPFGKMVDGMLDPEMIEDTVRIVNEAIKNEIQVEPNYRWALQLPLRYSFRQ